MKKYLIVLAVALVALAGCKKEGNKYTSLKFKNTEITLGVGATDKLQVLWEPATIADAPQCVWASSNEDVVSVDQNGNIAALTIGEANVTAKFDELSAVCKVIVKDPLDLIEWGGFILADHGVTPLSTDTLETTITLNGGTDVKCIMAEAEFWVWDKNIAFDTENYAFAGAGYMMTIPGTVWVITDDLNGKGPNYYYLGSDYVEIKNYDEFDWSDTANVYCGVTGVLGDAEIHRTWLYNDESTLDDMTEILGARLDRVDWNAGGKYLSLFDGIAGEGIYVGDETEVIYKSNISWFVDEDPIYCLYGLAGNLTEDEEDGKLYWDALEPGEWAPIAEKYYEKLEFSAAPRKKEYKLAENPKLTTKYKRQLPANNVFIKK